MSGKPAQNIERERAFSLREEIDLQAEMIAVRRPDRRCFAG
jgi:hypothetical protein